MKYYTTHACAISVPQVKRVVLSFALLLVTSVFSVTIATRAQDRETTVEHISEMSEMQEEQKNVQSYSTIEVNSDDYAVVTTLGAQSEVPFNRRCADYCYGTSIKELSGFTVDEFEAAVLHESKNHAQYFVWMEEHGYNGVFFAAVEAVESDYGRNPAGYCNTLSWTTDAVVYQDFLNYSDMWKYTLKRYNNYFCNVNNARYRGDTPEDINMLYAFWSSSEVHSKFDGDLCPRCAELYAKGVLTDADLPEGGGCINWDWSDAVESVMASYYKRAHEYRKSIGRE